MTATLVQFVKELFTLTVGVAVLIVFEVTVGMQIINVGPE
jgi:hypothetical protein